MKTELEIGERIVLGELLPKEGNFLTLRIIKKIAEKLSLTAQEIAEWEVKSSPGSIAWNPQKAKPVEIEFSDAEADFIRQELRKLDQGNRLKLDTLSAFEKFCGT
jgi:hypothetical protein